MSLQNAPSRLSVSAEAAIPSISLGAPLRLQDEEPYVVPAEKRWQHLYVLPVLLLEFLALSITRAVLPSILLRQYGSKVYLVLGFADCVRGLLAFVACPFFGKVSDMIGRKVCLFVTVLGSCSPVCSLALFPWDPQKRSLADILEKATGLQSASVLGDESESKNNWHMFGDADADNVEVHGAAITTFVILLSLSGIFSSTFTLVFAYISDSVRQQEDRVSAYGLALATFGLSYTIGPMAGGYLARTNTHDVFLCSLFFTILDLLYIYFILPESRETEMGQTISSSTASLVSMDHKYAWSPWSSLQIVVTDPFLRNVGKVAFLYYTGLWAIISTLSIYAVQRFHLSPERLGELMSALGLSTMIAEAVLVRIMVPLLGEKCATKVGLMAFLLQCIVLGLAYEGWQLFLCTAFSLFANLVYPSLSSLVSGNVEPDSVGEALGAINGVKALTEGIGPLVFGSLMTLSEHSWLPGWPYLLAAVLAYFAYKSADNLPDPEEDDYIHELDRKKRKNHGSMMLQQLVNTHSTRTAAMSLYSHERDAEEEDQGLLSDVDESENYDPTSDHREEDMTRLPLTFASLVNISRSC